MSVQYEFSLVVAKMRPPSHIKALRELLLTHKWLMVNIALLAESNKQDQQLVPIGTKAVEVFLPPFSRTCNLTCLCCYKCDRSYLSCSDKWILWYSLPVSGWNKCPPGHLPQECPWSHWLLWLSFSLGAGSDAASITRWCWQRYFLDFFVSHTQFLC